MRWAAAILFCLVCCVGPCSGKCPSFYKRFYENHFAEFPIPDEDSIRRSAISRRYDARVDDIWGRCVRLVLRHAMIVRASKEAGTLSYIGVYNLLEQDKFVDLEFPFTLLLDEVPGGVIAYVYPMVEVVEQGVSKERLELMKLAFTQKGEEFLLQLATELESEKSWPWLAR